MDAEANEENVLNFIGITDATPHQAAQYLALTENNLEQAIQLFFDSPNLDFGDSAASAAPSAPSNNAQNPINIDSDDEMSDVDAGQSNPAPRGNIEDDEAMARRLQEEMYGGGGGGGEGQGSDVDPETGVRAPMGRTTETLVGPGSNWGPQEDDIDALVQEQMARRQARQGRGAGIFNQQRTGQSSVWENATDPDTRRRELSAATGGASDASSKSNMLAELFRPPFEIMFQRSWDQARDEGKEQEKWLLVNIQDPAIFDCQILNRDIWKNEPIKETIKESFVFMQYSKDDPRGQTYCNYYFQARDSSDAYPHIAIVDPRTGEQVKIWSGPPVPNAVEFHAELHEFLDRYSLKANARNPVAVRKSEKKKVDVNRMTEEEMLEMALQNSLEGGKGPTEDDPDALTRDTASADKGKMKVEDEVMETEEAATNGNANSPFAQISSSNPHEEPANDPKTTTRIQFRSPDGNRIVRRFSVNDPVRRLYEWIKASPWEGKEGADFELVFLQKNLIDSLDSTIADAGLKNGSVMVEFPEQ